MRASVPGESGPAGQRQSHLHADEASRCRRRAPAQPQHRYHRVWIAHEPAYVVISCFKSSDDIPRFCAYSVLAVCELSVFRPTTTPHHPAPGRITSTSDQPHTKTDIPFSHSRIVLPPCLRWRRTDWEGVVKWEGLTVFPVPCSGMYDKTTHRSNANTGKLSCCSNTQTEAS